MEFIEIGDRLKSERTRLNLSMEQVMADTKLSRSNLEAMEAGNFKRLPHPVYAKGFVRNYANYLGLDGEELASYLDELMLGPKQDQENETFEQYEVRDVSGKRGGKKSWPSILLLLVLACAMVGLVFYFNSGKSEEAQVHGQAPAAQEQAALEPGALEQESAMPTEQSMPVQGEERDVPAQGVLDETASTVEEVAQDVAQGVMEEAESLSDEARSEAVAEQAAEQAESASQQAADMNAQDELAAAPEAADQASSGQQASSVHQVSSVQQADEAAAVAKTLREAGQHGVGNRVFSLIAMPDDASWMQVRIDDGPVKEYILRNGAGMNFNFKDTLYVRLGNGGGVTAYLDGKAYPINADKGQVRTLIIPE